GKPGRGRAYVETRQPALLLDHGSVRARLTAMGAQLRQFGVALFPKAPSRRQGSLVEALRARAVGRNLPRLERVSSDDLKGKQGVVLLLHGLMSTDVGTFDSLINEIEPERSLANMHIVGWPHDTLAPIEVNARKLAKLIETHLGPSGLPIVFVCHSRGGLVARAAAVELLEPNPGWADRLKGAVTFGTPHEGAELAECADEFLGKVLLLLTIRQTGRVVPLVDALIAVRKRK